MTKSTATNFVNIIAISSIVSILCIVLFNILTENYRAQEDQKSSVKCTNGKLYDVTYEGNITVYSKRAFTECKEN